MSRDRLFAVTVIGGAILFAVIAIGGALIWRSTRSATPASSPTSTSTVDPVTAFHNGQYFGRTVGNGQPSVMCQLGAKRNYPNDSAAYNQYMQGCLNPYS